MPSKRLMIKPQRSKSNMEIYALKFGQSVLGEDQIFRGGDRGKVRPISFLFYLIKTDERLILVDSGCDTMPGFEMEHFCGPKAVLSQCGLAPQDITDVIITHAHHDHIERVNLYTGACIYIQREAYERGKKYIPNDRDVQLFDESCEIVSGVKAVTIGGHAHGSSVVEITVGQTVYVIVGDECYLPDCFALGIPTGASVCPEKSERFLKRYSSGYHLLYCHDPSVLPDQNGIVRVC